MEFKTFVFYFLSAILVYAALRVSPCAIRYMRRCISFWHSSVRAVSGFSAGEFLAIALVLVYVGAVMVLFLFVVMMLDINLDRLREGFWSYLPLGSIVALLMVAEMGLVLGGKLLGWFEAEVPQTSADHSNVQAVGRLLFTDYVYPFELASVILLVGIVAAVALTLRGRGRASRSVRRSRFSSRRRDRVRVLQMPAEKEGLS
jgi:NADH-quinone oxidoreductase subunit J